MTSSPLQRDVPSSESSSCKNETQSENGASGSASSPFNTKIERSRRRNKSSPNLRNGGAPPVAVVGVLPPRIMRRFSDPGGVPRVMTEQTSETPNIKSSMVVCTLEESLERQTLKPCDKKDSKVSFDSISIRRYVRTVGDNPAVSSGPPLSLGWAYHQSATKIKVDEYEVHRAPRRRSYDDLKLPAMVRRRILENTWKVPPAQLWRAEDQAFRIQTNRRLTYSYRYFARTEEILESFGRKCRRLVRGTSKRRQQEWLWICAQKYNPSSSSSTSTDAALATLNTSRSTNRHTHLAAGDDLENTQESSSSSSVVDSNDATQLVHLEADEPDFGS